MTPEIYLRHAGPDPLDAEEIQEAVRELLLSSAPPALIRVIGRDSYEACASSTCRTSHTNFRIPESRPVQCAPRADTVWNCIIVTLQGNPS